MRHALESQRQQPRSRLATVAAPMLRKPSSTADSWNWCASAFSRPADTAIRETLEEYDSVIRVQTPKGSRLLPLQP